MSIATSDDTPPAGIRVATCAHDRDLAERLMAILVQVASLVDAARVAIPSSHGLLERGVADVEEFARQLYDQIGRLHVVWIHERRFDSQGALGRAWASFAAIGQQRGLLQFLAIGSRLNVEAVRRPCLLIIALLEPVGIANP